MNFEVLLKNIGGLGVYQWCVFSLMAVLSFWSMESVGINFIGGHMDHWCEVEELQNFTHDTQKYIAIPFDTDWLDEREEDDEVVFAQCDMYGYNYSDYSILEYITWDRVTMVTNDTVVTECDSWVYDQSEYYSSIMSEWDLVCGKTWLISFSSSCYMLGTLVGAGSAGWLSDKIGRLPTYFISVLLKFVGNFLAAISQNMVSFCVFRAIAGMGSTATYLVGFVVLMEVVVSTWRPLMGVFYATAFSLGYMLAPWLAYAIRDHVKFQILLALVNLLAFFAWWFVPESPRWLLINRKYDKAAKGIRYIAAVNHCEISEEFNVREIERNDDDEGMKKGTCADLFRYKSMCVRTLIIYLYWFTTNLMYYALTLNTGALYGNIYLNTSLAGAIEIPANLLALACLSWPVLGRRWTSALALICAGFCSLMTIPFSYADLGAGATMFSLIGKGFSTAAFTSIYIYSAELYPTEVRNVGMGTSSMWAKIGAIVAPFIGPVLANIWEPLLPILFGIFGTVTGLLTLLLPETLGFSMPETVEEASEFKGRKQMNTSKSIIINPVFTKEDEEDTHEVFTYRETYVKNVSPSNAQNKIISNVDMKSDDIYVEHI